MVVDGKPEGTKNKIFAGLLLVFELVVIIVLATCFTYCDATQEGHECEDEGRVTSVYGMFQDVHTMIFIGFGFLMTFLKKYGYSSIGLNFMIAAVIFQWNIILGNSLHGAFSGHSPPFQIGPETMITSDFAAGAVLISFGALLGKISPLQLVILGMFEIIPYTINEYIGVGLLGAVDMGGSMYVHTFGAYFGLAASWVLGKRGDKHPNNAANKTSDMFAMMGTIFLWMFWPSFNGALSLTYGMSRERIVVNTVLALTASCVAAFSFSALVHPDGKFDMVHIQNATLAGGVAVGSSSDLVIGAWGAIIIGLIAGAISVAGYRYVSPRLEKWGLHDTCGVHNLHGMPGVLGGLGGCISAAMAGTLAYGDLIGSIFGNRSADPASRSEAWKDAVAVCSVEVAGWDGLQASCESGGGTFTAAGATASGQALMQLGSLGITLLFAITFGAMGGLFIKAIDDVPDDKMFSDAEYWVIEGESDSEDGGIELQKRPEVAVHVTEPAYREEAAL